MGRHGGGAIPEVVEGTVKKLMKKVDVKTPRGSHTPGGSHGPSSPHTPTPKPKAPVPAWLQQRLKDGEQFNRDNHSRYPHNEVTLENGKRLDSYRPGEAIVSRKNTQLGDVNESTAREYVNEIDRKYAPGTVIKSTDHNGAVGGTRLNGDPVLEVPVQNGPIPPSILQHAREKGVDIVDVNGKIYT